MSKIRLSEHVKHGDTFYTPMTDPNGIGASLEFSNWSKDYLPEFLWIGLIINKMGRTEGLKSLYSIIEELNDAQIAIPQFSSIIDLEDEKQEQFWNIVTNHIDCEILMPLTVIVTPDKSKMFYNMFFNISENVDKCLDELLSVIKECCDFHQDLTSDICYIVLWFYIVAERFEIVDSQKITREIISNYYKYEHDNDIMHCYRSVIRATFQALVNYERTENNKAFSNQFWKTLGEISECKPLIIGWNKMDTIEFYNKINRTVDYIAHTNEDKKMQTKYQVIMGLFCYIFRIYKEIVNCDMQNSVGGRILFRSLIETYINMKYLLMKEIEIPDIYERFKAYGIGKYKLVMSKLREGKYTIPNKAQIDEKYLELIVNEEMNEAFINMSVGYFDRIKIKCIHRPFRAHCTLI